MKKFYVFIFLCLMADFSFAINDLLAHYPLVSDGVDLTGNNDTMIRVNAPFQDGGVYCNGDYSNMTLHTPQINNFSFTSLSVSFEFRADTFISKPVIVCGSGYRWLGFYLDVNGTVKMKYNNSNYETSSTTYNFGQWYTGLITYDGTTANLYLDGVLAVSKTVALTFILTDTEIGVEDYASGRAFKGVIKNLKITNSAYYGINETNVLKVKFYPNPVNDYAKIDGIDTDAVIRIFDMDGRLVRTLPFSNEPIDLSALREGMYMIRVEQNERSYSSRFIKM